MNQPSKQNTELGPKQDREGRAMLFYQKKGRAMLFKPIKNCNMINQQQKHLNINERKIKFISKGLRLNFSNGHVCFVL